MLRKVKRNDLLSFSFEALVDEWKGHAPLLLQFLSTVANIPVSSKAAPLTGICTAGAALLRQRNVHMSALHHVVGLILFHGNASKQVLYIYCINIVNWYSE